MDQESSVIAGQLRRVLRSRLPAVLTFLALTGAAHAAFAQCAKDTDCKGNRVCIEGRCTQPKACQADADCTGGLSCQNGLCLPAAAPPPPPPEPAPAPAPEPPPVAPEPPPPVAPEPPPPVAPEPPPQPPVYQPPPGPTPTVASAAPFQRKRSWTFAVGGAAGFFAKNLGKTSIPGLTINTPTKVIGVDTSLGFTLTQQKRLALELAFELGLLFDPDRDHGNYMAVPMAVDLGLRLEVAKGFALDARLGGGGAVSVVEHTDGTKGSTKMHPLGLLGVNFFFIDLLHLGLDTWFGKDNTLVVLKFGFGF